MAGYDGRGARFPLTIVRGADFAIALTVTSGGSPVNMSAATIAGEVHTSAGTLFDTMTATVSGASSNVVTLSFTDTETALLVESSYRWTLWVTRGADKRPWLAGQVSMSDGTTGQNGTAGAYSVTVDEDVSLAIDVAVVGPNAQTAASVTIADAGGYYTSTDVEGALAELPGQYAPLAGSSDLEVGQRGRTVITTRLQANPWASVKQNAAITTLSKFAMYPIWSGAGITIDILSVTITATGGAGSVMRAGVYYCDNEDPFRGDATTPTWTLAVDAGTVDTNGSTGQKTWSLAPLVIPARKWFAVGAVAQVGTVPSCWREQSTNQPTWSPFGSGNTDYYNNDPPAVLTKTGITGALPSTLSAMTADVASHGVGVSYRRTA